MSYQLTLPKELYSGENSLTIVKDIVLKLSSKKILVFTDKGIKDAGLVNLLEDILKDLDGEYSIYDGIIAEPSYLDVNKVIEDTEDYQPDLIIGFGGGSVMDTAKLCSILFKVDYTIEDLLKDATIAQKTTPTIMIPTTCGTGSEATINAIVAVPELETKIGIVNKEMIPDYVILDPVLIKKLPKQIVAATGVDALAHGVECLTSKKATPFSNLYALEASKLIIQNIRKAYEDPEDLKAKEALMLGAFYGGVAITGSGTTAVHALSYPLGGKYHIPHGVSNAMLFETVMRFNQDAIEEDLAKISDAINPSLHSSTVGEKAEYVIEQIADIVEKTDIPTNLQEFGLDESHLDILVESGSQQTRLLVNNKKELSNDDIRNIYLKII